MAIGTLEAESVERVGYCDLEGRPAFKIALETVGDRWYLYLSHFYYSGWSIVDVTDPSEPELVRFIEGPENTMTLQVQVADGRMLTSLERPRQGYGPVGDPMDPDAPYEEGVYVWDLSADPLDPDLVGHYQTGGAGTHRNFYNGGDVAYLCAHREEFTGGIVTLLDVSDPSDPTEVRHWWWPGQSPDDDEEATEPRYFHGPAYVDGDRAYLSYGRVGPVVLDVSDPTDPTYLTHLRMGDGVGSYLGTHSFIPIPDTNLAAVTTEAILGMHQAEPRDPLNYTYLVDVSDEREPGFDGREPVGPKVVSSMPLPVPREAAPYESYYDRGGSFGPHNVHHYRNDDRRLRTSDYLFATYFNAGLRVFDISDPYVPTEVGSYLPEDPTNRVGTRPKPALVSHFEDVVVDSRGNIYCTDANHGLFVLRFDGL